MLCSCVKIEKEALEEELYTQSDFTNATNYIDCKHESFFIGSINSNVYHYLNCRYVKNINPYNKITFSSIEEAKDEGYRRCLVCSP